MSPLCKSTFPHNPVSETVRRQTHSPAGTPMDSGRDTETKEDEEDEEISCLMLLVNFVCIYGYVATNGMQKESKALVERKREKQSE